MTKLIGVLNITPDSFSDGGLYFNKNSALEKVYQLIKEGADIIDIGAESTRPKATFVSLKEELRRLKEILPETIKIAHENNVLVSIDSYKIEVIKFALEHNIDVINDVRGLETEAKIRLIANFKGPYKLSVIIMHNLGVPPDRNINLAQEADIISQLKTWAEKKITKLAKFGIKAEQIIFDPGLGFGKTFAQCFEILKRIEELQQLPIKLCIGHSKKGFVRSIGEASVVTLAISAFLAARNVDFIRIHDVGLHYGLLKKLT